MPHVVRLDHVAVVLQKPRYPENIGSVARAMCNMGLHHLIVVAPENWDPVRINLLATHGARGVVDAIERFDNLADALARFHYVLGTTARVGRQRLAGITPASLPAELVDISQNNQIALVFGPEDKGLTNEDTRLCHRLIRIPTAEFSSLNLAQAVMVVCYELYLATRQPGGNFQPRLAARHELDGMYAQLKEILVRIDHIKPDNPDYWMNKMRAFGTRMRLRAREVAIIRGICRQINWYAGKCYHDGWAAGKKGDAPDPPTGKSVF